CSSVRVSSANTPTAASSWSPPTGPGSSAPPSSSTPTKPCGASVWHSSTMFYYRKDDDDADHRCHQASRRAGPDRGGRVPGDAATPVGGVRRPAPARALLGTAVRTRHLHASRLSGRRSGAVLPHRVERG